MSKHGNSLRGARARARLICGGAAALLLAACASHAKKVDKAHEAAIYNVQLGLAYMSQGDLERAKEKLDRALSQDADSADVHSARAQLFARLGEKDKADSEYRAALRLAPQDPRMVNNYAVYLCQNGRSDDGVKRFLEAARNPMYPTPEAAYTNAGVCLRSAKRDEEARVNFGRALQLKPNFAEAQFQLANLQFDHGEFVPARNGIDGFIGTYNATPDLLLLAVRVARAQGDRVAAQRYARKLQLDFPGTDQARALAALGPG
ncbi:MAG TPA: type IV pilus biogenesis/stability protein PilW [Steroidobacteraceae bacterium]|jgi:type IV pilus assembly protein PilF|nr:type IV pilus biogenesis/stability protein PilW [Steroidobacteraceae bacterium]